MNIILVPTDFSPVAKNAAKYAISLASDLRAKKIIFYNAYQAIPPVINEPSAPAIPVMDLDTMQDISRTSLKHFTSEMKAICPPEVQIEQITEYAAIAIDINEICKKTGAEIVVMGITGASKIEEILIGSTALSVVKNTDVPVIIVPDGASYSSIKNVMLACDFKKVAETIPVKLLKNILNITGASLNVLNVYESEKELSADKTKQQELLNSLLNEYSPRFHFVNNTDFISGINNFVDDHHIDLIIAIPKKHGILDGLFRERHTKKLAFHSHIPLMYIHQEDLS